MMRLLVLACLLYVIFFTDTCQARDVRIPFICKIRKINCSRRPDSVCCQSVADDRIDIVDDEEDDYNETGAEAVGDNDGDNLIQIASNIHEVVVKPNGEPVGSSNHEKPTSELKVTTPSSSSSESSSPSTTTAAPSPKDVTTSKVPAFCLKLKFNCKILKFHTCCKYQLPVSSAASSSDSGSSVKESTLVKITKDKIKKPKEIKEVEKTPNEVEQIDQENAVEENKIIEKPVEKKSLLSKKGKSKYGFSNSLRKKSNIFKNPVKSSLFGKSRQSEKSKSGLCRIINCSRSKNHFCCKDIENEKEEEEAQESVVEVDAKEELVSDITGDDSENSSVEESVSDIEKSSEATTVEDETTTMMSYDVETTTAQNINDAESSSESITTSEPIFHEEIEHETEDSTNVDDLTTMMSYPEYTQMDEEDNTESVTKAQDISDDDPENDSSEESFEEVTMVSKSKSESYEETRIWYDGINENGEFVENKPYHIYQDDNGETVVQVYPVYVPPNSFPAYDDIDNDIDNTIDNSHEDRDTDIINEITCENVDCLAWPGNKCCSPHVTKKRHSQEEDINDKITATIIRIVKSVRWV